MLLNFSDAITTGGPPSLRFFARADTTLLTANVFDVEQVRVMDARAAKVNPRIEWRTRGGTNAYDRGQTSRYMDH